jgi:hypothetical protein
MEHIFLTQLCITWLCVIRQQRYLHSFRCVLQLPPVHDSVILLFAIVCAVDGRVDNGWSRGFMRCFFGNFEHTGTSLTRKLFAFENMGTAVLSFWCCSHVMNG